MGRRRIATAAAVLVLVPVAPAAADDAAVFDAYTARDADVAAAGEAYLRASDRATSRRTRRAYRGVIRADRRINRLLTLVEGDLEPTTGSTEEGGAARTAALVEVRQWRRANRVEIRAVRALLAGQEGRARRRIARAERIMVRRAIPAGDRAVEHFRAIGLEPPGGPLSRAN